MKKLYFDRITSAIAVVLWMAVIFLFSSQTGMLSGNTSGSITRWLVEHLYIGFGDLSELEQSQIMAFFHTFVRKGAHFTEYAILAVLVSNAVRTYKLGTLLRFVIPVAFGGLYAVTDEIHQYFVPDRACTFTDVLIDTGGAIFGTTVFLLVSYIIYKVKNKNRI